MTPTMQPPSQIHASVFKIYELPLYWQVGGVLYYFTGFYHAPPPRYSTVDAFFPPKKVGTLFEVKMKTKSKEIQIIYTPYLDGT